MKPNAPLLLGLLLASASNVYAAEYVGRVGDIQDGDTFDLDKVRIRICGMNAPERGDAGFDASTAALTAIIQGNLVRCVQVGSGTPCDGRSRPTNNGRIVAQCFVGDIDIARPLVERGFACDWVKFSNGYYSQGGLGKQCQ
jgi:micrococcal nuclease